MRGKQLARVSKTRSLLAWIDGSERGAVVRWKNECLGNWGDLNPQWFEGNGRIMLCLSVGTRLLRGEIGSITTRPGSAVLSVRLQGARVADAFEIHWNRDSGVRSETPTSLVQPLVRWMKGRLPGCQILSATRRSDPAHTISGAFARLHARRGGRDFLVLACSLEAAPEVANVLPTQGLIWLELLARGRKIRPENEIWLLAPMGQADIVRHRASLMDPRRLKVEVFEYRPEMGGNWSVRPVRAPRPLVENRDFHWPVLGPFRWNPLLERVLELAPELIRRYPRFHDHDSLRLRGLEFARVEGRERDHISFGIGPIRSDLSVENFEDIRALVESILYFRRADGPDPSHSLYRLQAERWLESLILDEIPRLFPELAQEAIYSQIPVYLGREAGRVDILGANREGTLVVIELKVDEDPNLPLQGLDYWGRVVQHNLAGDFKRRGYFSEVQLNRSPPKIYLLAPIFSFHDSTERLLRFFDPKIEVWKIGINQDWRVGVKILRRGKSEGDPP